MATQLEGYVFKSKQRPRYNWSEWFNGKAWHLVQGVNFPCSIDAFLNSVYSMARKRNGTVHVDKDEKGVTIKFTARGQ